MLGPERKLLVLSEEIFWNVLPACSPLKVALQLRKPAVSLLGGQRQHRKLMVISLGNHLARLTGQSHLQQEWKRKMVLGSELGSLQNV